MLCIRAPKCKRQRKRFSSGKPCRIKIIELILERNNLMTQTKAQHYPWVMACATAVVCLSIPQPVIAQNSVVWESSQSKIDTTNFAGFFNPYYWFANFSNATPVTGAPMNQNEVRTLPSWLHFETNPAFIGKDDGGVNNDGTFRTGFSFSESPPNGATSIGGQPGFNTLTLFHAMTGRSGQAIDSLSTTGNTSPMTAIRILAGAPEAFRIWVVTDNGAGQNFHVQTRMRVNLRDTAGPPLFDMDADQQEAEALPNGERLNHASNIAKTQNGIADAWAFRVSGVNANDILTIWPTSAGGIPGSLPGFAGFMIQVIPEPSSALLLLLGLAGTAFGARRRS